MPDNRQPFSWKWVGISLAIFIAAELVLGMVVGQILVGKYASFNLKWMLQGALNLLSYFVGGVVIGVISPKIRIHEPAVGAFCAVGFTLILTIFSPFTFLAFSLPKLVIGGTIAFFLALTGAKIGEKITGQM